MMFFDSPAATPVQELIEWFYSPAVVENRSFYVPIREIAFSDVHEPFRRLYECYGGSTGRNATDTVIKREIVTSRFLDHCSYTGHRTRYLFLDFPYYLLHAHAN